ncbi:hypothetical protein FGO68_gene16427 [Halteria grandinella]|uniref:Uncharacterized protein n=1 Tax=Halteria grandinella TaxID=5974 RepID=A0A8J8NJ57_HALGN|nr:hypothetical protein FGO68_gene16427 [Halteria grandinella]
MRTQQLLSQYPNHSNVSQKKRISSPIPIFPQFTLTQSVWHGVLNHPQLSPLIVNAQSFLFLAISYQFCNLSRRIAGRMNKRAIIIFQGQREDVAGGNSLR